MQGAYQCLDVPRRLLLRASGSTLVLVKRVLCSVTRSLLCYFLALTYLHRFTLLANLRRYHLAHLEELAKLHASHVPCQDLLDVMQDRIHAADRLAVSL